MAKGYAASPIRNANIKNVTIEKVRATFDLENVVDIDFIDTHINRILMENPK